MRLYGRQQTHRLALISVVIACLCGYFARVLQEALATPREPVLVEPGDVALANSFSEVEMLKTALARLSANFLLELRRDPREASAGHGTSTPTSEGREARTAGKL